MVDATLTLLDERATLAASRASRLGLAATDTIPLEPRASDNTIPEPTAFDVDIGALPRVAIDGLDDRDDPGGDGRSGADLIGLATLGQGGMGRVLLARQRSLAREVAVKTLRNEAAPHERIALLREGRVAGSLEHPGIVPVHALGVDVRGRPLLVMKRVSGVDWETLLRHPTHSGWSALLAAKGDHLEANLEILLRVCQTLEFAHSRGIIHRNLKPANVMVGAFGEVYLVDWGIATPTRSRDDAVVGTPAYMAPEMISGEAIDERTDVYLLGAVLHRVLVGKPRHRGATVQEVIVAAARSEPYSYPPSAPARLAKLCNAATAHAPARRPQSVLALREELLAFARYRSAFALSDAALTRLALLERLLANDGVLSPSDLIQAYRLGTEARFGFTQCLRSYPEHGPAREGVRQCLAVLIDLELRQGHVDSAAAVLAEVEEPATDLVRRVEDARASASRATAEHDRLRAMDRDLDPSVAKGARALAFASVLLVGTVITGLSSLGPKTYAPGNGRLVAYAAGLLALSLGLGAVFRQRLMSNAFNRRFAGVLFIVLTMMFANRTAGWVRSAPIDLVLASDIMLMLVGAALGALMVQWRVVVAVPPLLLGFVALHAYPHHFLSIYGASTSVGFAVCVWGVWSGRARER